MLFEVIEEETLGTASFLKQVQKEYLINLTKPYNTHQLCIDT